VTDQAAEKALMAKIRAEYSAAIAASIHGTPIPEEFLAALAAGESGGIAAATRIEPTVLRDLCMLLANRKPNYGAIRQSDLCVWLMKSASFSPAVGLAQAAGKMLDLATSWGPCQIMGYQVLRDGREPNDLQLPNIHFAQAVRMLAAFTEEWHIDFESAAIPASNGPYAKLFRCWNTGHPDGVTYDPEYVPNGLLRMQLYKDLCGQGS